MPILPPFDFRSQVISVSPLSPSQSDDDFANCNFVGRVWFGDWLLSAYLTISSATGGGDAGHVKGYLSCSGELFLILFLAIDGGRIRNNISQSTINYEVLSRDGIFWHDNGRHNYMKLNGFELNYNIHI